MKTLNRVVFRNYIPAKNDFLGLVSRAEANNAVSPIKCFFFENSTVKPNPPQGVTIESKTSRTITISWKSGFSGNSEINSYSVEIRDNGLNFSDAYCQGWSDNSCTVSGLDTNATLEGLLPHTMYFLRVFADNKVGRSDASSEVHALTDEEGTSLFYYLCEVSISEAFVLR